MADARRPVIEALAATDATVASLRRDVEALGDAMKQLVDSVAASEQRLAERLDLLHERLAATSAAAEAATAQLQRWETAPRQTVEGEEWLLVRRASE